MADIFGIGALSTDATNLYNNILGIEHGLSSNMTQVNNLILSLDFVQDVQNAMLKSMISKIQQKYATSVGVIVDLTQKRRDYMEKMIDIVSNKQKILQQLAQKLNTEMNNPLGKIVKNMSGNRDVLALARAYFEQSYSMEKVIDARLLVNHRLNAMYAYLDKLQGSFLAALGDFMNTNTVVEVRRLSNESESLLGKLVSLENTLVSTENRLLGAGRQIEQKLGGAGVVAGMMMGGNGEDYLVKLFNSLADAHIKQNQQVGGDMLAMGVASVPTLINQVDTVSLGAVFNNRLEQCQQAWHKLNQTRLSTQEMDMVNEMFAGKSEFDLSEMHVKQEIIIGFQNILNDVISLGNIEKIRVSGDVSRFTGLIKMLAKKILEVLDARVAELEKKVAKDVAKNPAEAAEAAEDLKKFKSKIEENKKILTKIAATGDMSSLIEVVKRSTNVQSLSSQEPQGNEPQGNEPQVKKPQEGGKKKSKGKKRSSKKRLSGGKKKSSKGKKRSSKKGKRMSGGKKKSSRKMKRSSKKSKRMSGGAKRRSSKGKKRSSKGKKH